MSGTSLSVSIQPLIASLAEPALKEFNLLLRPIPYFEYRDRFHFLEAEIFTQASPTIAGLEPLTARRVVRAQAFAQTLCQDFFRNFQPSWPQRGDLAVGKLWGAAMMLDQLLDETGIDPQGLRERLDANIARVACQPQEGNSTPEEGDPEIAALEAMVGEILQDAHRTFGLGDGPNETAIKRFVADLERMLDAELSSLGVELNLPPDKWVRQVVYDKSVLLCWNGYQAGMLGENHQPMDLTEAQQLCDHMGEILWIMDDLADIQEDLERGIWNRSLWRLAEAIGERRFRSCVRNLEAMLGELQENRIVEEEIAALAARVDLLERHPAMLAPEKIRRLMSFWIPAWLGIYR